MHSAREPHLEKPKHLRHVLRFLLVAVYALQHLQLQSSCDMPKCEVDPVLQDQMRRFMSENGLTVSGAAAQLGVDRTTFWRFCDSGRARDDTRALYREALAKRNKDAAARVADDAVDTDVLAVQARSAVQGALADRELRLIRKACEGVLALLDVYEAHSLGRKI